MKILSTFFLAALSSLIALPCSAKDYDVIIRNGTIYDGGEGNHSSQTSPFKAIPSRQSEK